VSATPDPSNRRPLHLFEAFGVELEYMLVDRRSGAVAPVADSLIAAAVREGGDARAEAPGDVEFGLISWSNELCLHVLELKGTDPLPSLATCNRAFAESIRQANRLAGELDARLMPGAMHPTMNPAQEAKLWPHECNDIYRLFDAIFDCRGHGWSNLQSTHINLPFVGDDRPDSEFGRLHAAIRLLLPILPALAASSPYVDGRVAPTRDARLDAYRVNARRIPAVTGAVIPEAVFTRSDYEARIYGPIAEALAVHDPDGLLNPTWVNARGCIARFDRGAIEIRVLDVQECPTADLAILAAIVAVLRDLVDERWTSLASQQAWSTEPLAALLRATIGDAEETVIDDPNYLSIFGLDATTRSARELWRTLIDRSPPESSHADALEVILGEGTLATRMLALTDGSEDPAAIRELSRALCDCLAENRLLSARPKTPTTARKKRSRSS